jgi:hypothetical protein
LISLCRLAVHRLQYSHTRHIKCRLMQ